MAFVRCSDASSIADLTFNFTITEHREQGMTFDAIAEWLNKEGYMTVRGRKFRGAHAHSILRKRLAKEELLKRKHPPVWSDFSIEVVDKTILMSDFGFSEKRTDP